MNAKTAYIGVGSNLGDTLGNCLKAIDLIDTIPGCKVKDHSGFYRTEPVDVKDQDWYMNAVVSLSAELPAQDLLEGLLAIEAGMGRKRKKKWASRTIDLDILMFGQEVINENALTVPHPLMHVRRFVLVPMAQLAPDLIHPVMNKTMARLLEDFSGQGQAIIPMEDT